MLTIISCKSSKQCFPFVCLIENQTYSLGQHCSMERINLIHLDITVSWTRAIMMTCSPPTFWAVTFRMAAVVTRLMFYRLTETYTHLFEIITFIEAGTTFIEQLAPPTSSESNQPPHSCHTTMTPTYCGGRHHYQRCIPTTARSGHVRLNNDVNVNNAAIWAVYLT